MWMIFGFISVLTGLLNGLFAFQKKNTKYLGYISLSCTALMLCAFYSIHVQWVAKGEWSSLMDVVPTMSKVLWIYTIVSVLLNGIPIFIRKKR